MNNNEWEYLFLGSRLKQLGENISSQISKILKQNDIGFEARSLSVLSTLYNDSPTSIKELSEQLRITHPAVVQIVNNLRERKLINLSKAESDKRVSLVELTEKGKEEFENILPVLKDIETVIANQTEESGVDVANFIRGLEKSFAAKSILTGVDELMKERLLKEIKIVPYSRKYKKDFKRLNYEWLNKYFEVEEEDEKILSNPEKEVIKKGGEIFFALSGNEAVGTCAVIKVNRDTYELAKMAVTEKMRGRQIGKKLVLTSIGFAVTQKAKKLILCTSRKLIAANRLYKGLGFIEVEKQPDPRYKRELIYMELDLE